MSNAIRHRLGYVCAVILTLLAAGLTSQTDDHSRSSALQQQQREAGPLITSQARATRSFTSAQMASVRRRVALATALITRFEQEARTLGRGTGWRQATLESLLALPPTSLKELQTVESVDELATAVAGIVIQPVLGSTTEDLVYKPISPCRYIDTRNVSGMVQGFRGYNLGNTGATYGGSSACNPTALFGVSKDSFGALAMNVTIVSPLQAPGYLAVKPTQTAAVTSFINWYEPNTSVLANQGVLTMDQSAAPEEFWIETSSATHVVVDIFGAFIPAQASPLLQVQLESSISLGPGVIGSVGSPICPAGYSVTGGSCPGSVSSYVAYFYDTSVNFVCTFRNLSTTAAATVAARVICSRTSGR